MNEKNLVPNSERTPTERKENARKAGIASGKARRAKKTIAQALRQVLDEPLTKGSRQTRLDGISVKAVKKIFDNPDIKDLRTLAEILGEFKQTIQAEGMTLNISTSEEGKENVQRLLQGEGDK